jgi:hypothetical protein
VDHGDGQKRAPGGQPSCGNLDRRTKKEEHKLNLRLMGFEAKEGETKKELVQ